MYVLSGSFESFSKDLETDTPPLTQVFRAGDLVDTPPMVAHAYRYLEDTVFLNITLDHRDTDRYGEHTISYRLIE